MQRQKPRIFFLLIFVHFTSRRFIISVKRTSWTLIRSVKIQAKVDDCLSFTPISGVGVGQGSWKGFFTSTLSHFNVFASVEKVLKLHFLASNNTTYFYTTFPYLLFFFLNYRQFHLFVCLFVFKFKKVCMPQNFHIVYHLVRQIVFALWRPPAAKWLNIMAVAKSIKQLTNQLINQSS